MDRVSSSWDEALRQTPHQADIAQYVGDIDADADLLAIVEIAAGLLNAPGATFSSFRPTEEFVHFGIGIDPGPIPLAASLCRDLFPASALDLVMRTDDAATRGTFKKCPVRIHGSAPRFCAAAAVTVAGCRVGALAIYDSGPRPLLSRSQQDELRRLARLFASLLQLKHDSRAKAEADMALLQVRHRHALALRAANIATWSWDIGRDAILCDETLHRMFALPEGSEVTGQSLLCAIAPDDRERMRKAIYAAVHRDEEYVGEFRTAEGGRWVLGMGRIHDRSEDGTARTMFGVYLDITERKAAERKTRLLLRELNHRVKNTLAILQSVAQQTLRRSRSPGDFSRAFSGRLQALAATHTLLSDGEWQDIDIGLLVRSQLLPYTASYEESVSVSGPGVALGPDPALALSLVIHELASNAAQHGAFTRDAGRVDIDYDLAVDAGRPVLVLTWSESGGPEVVAPAHPGFGSMIIRHSLDKIIGSKVDVDFRPQGMRASMCIPL